MGIPGLLERECTLRLSRDYHTIRVASRRVQATNYSETKDFAREFISFLTQSQTLSRRLETSTRKWMNGIKPDKDKP